MFTWLRNKVRDCVLGGVNDALEIIEAAGPEGDTNPLAAALASRLRPQLPAPVETEHVETNGRKRVKV